MVTDSWPIQHKTATLGNGEDNTSYGNHVSEAKEKVQRVCLHFQELKADLPSHVIVYSECLHSPYKWADITEVFEMFLCPQHWYINAHTFVL